MPKLMPKYTCLALVICVAATKSLAADPSTTLQPNATMAAAQALIDAEDFNEALELLESLIAENPNDADALNLAGYAARNMQNLADSAIYYAGALESDPNHKGALEYQGELYLSLKRPNRAKANLNRLREICGETCEEYVNLAEKISTFEATN